MKKLAATIVEFGEVMAEVGSKNTRKDIIKKTFSKMSDMLNVASTSQPAETSTLLEDDPIFNDENFLAAVSALKKAFIVTTNPAEHPKEAALDGPPSSPKTEKNTTEVKTLFDMSPYWTANNEKLSFVTTAKEKLLSNFAFMDPSAEHPKE
nr:platelet glycoprotein Ib alpha chain-like [Ipomoea batatas]